MKKLILVVVLIGLTAAFIFADTFYLQNGTGVWDFYFIFVSDSRSDDPGDDLLGDMILHPGEVLRIDTTIPLGSTSWDIIIIDEDGDIYTLNQRRIRSNETVSITLSDLM